MSPLENLGWKQYDTTKYIKAVKPLIMTITETESYETVLVIHNGYKYIIKVTQPGQFSIHAIIVYNAYESTRQTKQYRVPRVAQLT